MGSFRSRCAGRRVAIVFSIVATVAGLAATRAGAQVVSEALPGQPTGYLTPERRPDDRTFLPAPPAADSAVAVADMAVFRATRMLENSPRWRLAARDDELEQSRLLGDFGCARGSDLSTVPAPALSRVLTRSAVDLHALVEAAKDRYRRPRPFLLEQGPLCIVPSAELAASGAYPSGHAALGWLYALLLAEIEPAHAAAVVARGRAFGESGVVCGVHYVSDIQAGRTLATALVATLHGNADFNVDMVEARTELATLRAQGAPAVDDGVCTTEQGNLKTPW